MKNYDIEIQNLREENEELQKAVAELLEDNKGLQAQLNAKCDFCKKAISKETAKEIIKWVFQMQEACYTEEAILGHLMVKYRIEFAEIAKGVKK